MINTQRIIKYIAIGLALLLTVNIISAIMYGFITIGTIFTSDDDYINEKLKNLEVSSSDIQVLNIEIASSNIIIKEGSSLKIKTNNKYINLKEKNNKLSIIEEEHNWINKNETSDLIIYIPSEYLFDEVSIENGAGKINLEKLHTKELEMDLGAGKVDIQNLTVTKNANIDGGTGEVVISNGNINYLDIDMGIGKVTITSSLTGIAEISAAIGDLELNLIGENEDYKIILDKGLGNATLDGEKMKNSTYYGNGPNLIDISGGIGSIKINFIDNQ